MGPARKVLESVPKATGRAAQLLPPPGDMMRWTCISAKFFESTAPTNLSGTPKRKLPLLFREARVGLHFINLLGVALAVRRDEQHPLIGIELLAERAVGGVLA